MQKGTAALFLLITGLLIVGLVGVFSFGLIKPKISSNPQVPSLPFKVLTPSLKLVTYTNKTLGFEFQYAKQDLKVQEDSEEAYNKRGNSDFRKNFKGYVGYEPGKFLGAVVVLDKSGSFETNPISIWVFDNPDNISADNWFAKYWYYPYVWGVFDWTSKGHITPDTEATISGQLAKYKIVSYQPGSPKFLYISFDSKMYLLRIIGESGDKILSTFRFSK